jgi:hypothetical protein
VLFKTVPFRAFSPFFEKKKKWIWGITQKWVMTVAPLFTMLTKQRLWVVSFVKINKIELLKAWLFWNSVFTAIPFNQKLIIKNYTTLLFWYPNLAIF